MHKISLILILSTFIQFNKLHAETNTMPIVQIYSEVKEEKYITKILANIKRFLSRFTSKCWKIEVEQIPTENSKDVTTSSTSVKENLSISDKRKNVNCVKRQELNEDKSHKKDMDENFIKDLANSIFEEFDKKDESAIDSKVKYFENKAIKKIRKHIPKKYNEYQARKFTLYSRFTLRKSIFELKSNIANLNTEIKYLNLEKIDQNVQNKLIEISKLNLDVIRSMPSPYFFAPLNLEDVFNRRTQLNNIQTTYYDKLNKIYDELKQKFTKGENKKALDLIKRAIDKMVQCSLILNASTKMI